MRIHQEGETKTNKKEVMCMHAARCLAIILFSLIAAIPAAAAIDGNPDMKITLAVEKKVIVTDEEGKSRIEWRPAAETHPGDELRYTIFYTNLGGSAAQKAVIMDPVPAGTTYIGNSAGGRNSRITFSLDGRNFESPPLLTYTVKQPDGTDEERTAGPEMYTHIKWVLSEPLPPGNSGYLTFRVRVK